MKDVYSTICSAHLELEKESMYSLNEKLAQLLENILEWSLQNIC